jgi:hypothetical protein
VPCIIHLLMFLPARIDGAASAVGAESGGGAPTYRSGELGRAQHGAEGSSAKLPASVAVNHRGADWLAAGDRGPEGGDGELGGHPVTDAVADDPVGEAVLDGAAVELALGRGVLGDVGQPHRVRSGCG